MPASRKLLQRHVLDADHASNETAPAHRLTLLNPKLELATTGAEPELHHGISCCLAITCGFRGIPSQLHRLRALPGMEFKFFRHNNCCLRWIESPRTARIVRGWTRRATNLGRTARAVAPANAERLATPPSQL